MAFAYNSKFSSITKGSCWIQLGLRVFVIVIPKEGWPRVAAPIIFLGMTPTIKYYCLHTLYSVVGVIPKEGLAGPQPANPSLGMTTTKTLRSVFS